MDLEEFKAKMGAKYGIKVPEQKKETIDWDKRAASSNHVPHHSSNRQGNYSGTQNRTSIKNAKPTTEIATAPYNFVSLPMKVLPSELVKNLQWENLDKEQQQEAYRQYIQKSGTQSGYIDLELTTLTPCFIGGSDPVSFAPNGQPIIPGSTLRGLTKNLFKIITCGAMRRDEDFTDRHLYFRCLMAPKSMPQLAELNAYYKSRMTTKNQKGEEIKKAKPGFLVRETHTGKYYICPAEIESVPMRDYVPGVPRESKVGWDDHNKKAYCLTGRGKNKEYIRCLRNADWKTRYEVPDSVIKEYRKDKNRRGVNLLDEKSLNVHRDGQAREFTGCKEFDRVTPCFFIRENEEIKAFGHGRSFRIPYEKSVGDAVPAAMQPENIIDYADAVFGRKDLWGSRVYFEDAVSVGPVKLLPKHAIKPQLSPNPTSFQLYLKQKRGEFPHHWDTNAEIRGYKLYWHQKITNEWQDTAKTMNKNVTHEIAPIAAGTKFYARIRFCNLSKAELGALLKVFNLTNQPERLAYKVGQGKSVGLGSVRIIAKLQIENIQRYKSLLTKDGWNPVAHEMDGKAYIAAYEHGLGECQQEYEFSCGELVRILDWQATAGQAGWNKKVASMSGDVQSGTVDQRYISKALLPTILEVTKL